MIVRIEHFQPGDWPGVREIYLQGIATGHATFELDAPAWEKWDEGKLAVCRLVARSEEGVVGWAALSPVSNRCVYGGVAEVSVYVADHMRGRGVGLELLQRLVSESEAEGLWTLQAGIFPENRASIRLHESAGFRIVGIREKLGQMNGVWRDVVLMERRSTVVGR
jgi:phosphinothricin acetyltransferase